jgi:hypothetical protein
MLNLQRDKIAGKPSTIIKLTNDAKLKLIEKIENNYATKDIDSQILK